MSNRGFLAKHGIVRSAIRQDLVFFAIPALVVFAVGLGISARDGWDGMVDTVWLLVRHPKAFHLLSIQNVVGLVLIVLGFTVDFVGMGTLWRYHSSTLVIRKDHRLITHGIYRFTRHPIYLGVIVVCIGPPVYASSVYGLLTMLVLIPIFLNRIGMEERLLTEEFGDAHRAYLNATRKLIPFIY